MLHSIETYPYKKGVSLKSMQIKTLSLPELWEQYGQKKEVVVRNELTERYSGLVKFLASRLAGRYRYLSYTEDLVSEGLIALMDAVEKFDLKRNVKFETFSSIKIRGAMIDYIRRQDCFPRRLKKIAKNINDAENTLSARLGRSPNDAELASFMNISLAEYEKILGETCALNIISFEKLIYEQEMEEISMHEQPDMIPGPEQEAMENELRKALAKILAGKTADLTEQENTVISLYYKEHLKVKEIAEIIGVSEPRVSQIHSNALRKLKRQLEEYLN